LKRYLLCLPLLGVAPLFYFFGFYFGGAGFIPENFGFISSAASMFIFPWAIAALCVIVSKAKQPSRVVLFVGALIVQGVLLFALVPPGTTCQTMGFAHRLKGEFNADELRGCAELVRQKFHDGSLQTHARSKDDHFIVGPSALVVSDSELSTSLRGRFQRVYIQKLPDRDVEQVIFALGTDRGILCDRRKDVREFFMCSIADGVQAYRYQRL
jgi:hypothetical protein